MRIQSNLERLQIVRDILSNLDDLPDELVKEVKDSFIEEDDVREKRRKEYEAKDKLRLNGPSTEYQKSNNVVNNRITLNPLSDLERDKDWEQRIGEKLYKLSDMIKKVGDDITKKGYLTKDPSLRQSIALGTDAVITYLQPLYNDKFIGEWRDLFNEFVKRYMHDHNFTEEPEFIRQYRYELNLESGNVKDLHEFSDEYYLSGNIIKRINNVIKISDCIPFFAALFENNRQVRYKQQLERWQEKN